MPHTINMFPWRLYQAKRRSKILLFDFLSSGFFGLIIILFWLFFIRQTLAEQEARNNYLATQNKYYVPKIAEVEGFKQAKNHLLARVQLTDQLQQESELALLVWQTLSQAMPKNVYLTSITKRNAQITIEGRSKTSKAIAQLMKNLTNSHYFGKVVLSSINETNTHDNNNRESSFKITLPIVSANQILK